MVRKLFFPASALVLGMAMTFAATSTRAQELSLPRASPRVEIVQTVGASTIRVEMGRPGVKGRAIFGPSGIVPYDAEQPWRTGADEPTSVELSHDVEVEGKVLPAGRYGLYTIPGRTSWTIIFNRNLENAFAYQQEEDILRVEVEPGLAPFKERLIVEFEELDDPSRLMLVLRWAHVRVPVELRFDLAAIVLVEARTVLSEQPDDWLPWYRAANFSLQNGGDAAEALAWIERSIELEETRANLNAKIRLLNKLGREDETEALKVRLERFSRDSWQRVDEITDWMEVRVGSWVADVGAGDGYLTTRLADAVGMEGHVFAVDIDERALERLSDKLEENDHTNVTVVHGASGSPRLPPGALDAIVIINSYHEMTEYESMLAAMLRSLKAGGRFVLVEPMGDRSRGKDRETQVQNHHLEIGIARQELEAAGFEMVEASERFIETPVGDTEWLLVATKPK